MTPESVIDIFRQGIYVTVILLMVIITPGVIVGLVVAMFQAATQINEMSLSFVPKFLITSFVMLIAGPWLLSTMINYTESLISNIPNMIG